MGVPGGPGEEGTWDGVPGSPLEDSTLTARVPHSRKREGWDKQHNNNNATIQEACFTNDTVHDESLVFCM